MTGHFTGTEKLSCLTHFETKLNAEIKVNDRSQPCPKALLG